MQSSIVGLSILWGLASFGVQGDFIESRDSVAPSWQAESRVEMEGYLIESLGEDRWALRLLKSLELLHRWDEQGRRGFSVGARSALLVVCFALLQ